MKTTIVNVRRAERGDWDVYIGRAVGRSTDRRCRVGSVFANHFRVGVEVRSAEAACDAFEELMRTRLTHGSPGRKGVRAQSPGWWLEQLLELRGKRLGCWCHPDPCHGHVLVKLLEEYCP